MVYFIIVFAFIWFSVIYLFIEICRWIWNIISRESDPEPGKRKESYAIVDDDVDDEEYQNTEYGDYYGASYYREK